MALINCKDCTNEISDSAESCPKCGAPVPKILKKNEEQCPHCMTVVDSAATTCPGCGAKKGYATNAYGVMGKVGMITLGLGLPAVFIIAAPISALFFVPLMLFVIWRLKKGPVWYTSRNPTR